jgi:hypothetical protein
MKRFVMVRLRSPISTLYWIYAKKNHKNIDIVQENDLSYNYKIKMEDKIMASKTAKEIKYDEYFNEYNMKILEKSIAQADAGQLIVKTIEKLEAM